MNNLIKAALLTLTVTLISSNIANAKPCSPPPDGACAFYSPDKPTHIGVLVIFKKAQPNQVVYLDGDCGFGVYTFKPFSPVNVINKYPTSKVSLKFTYCQGGELINEETINPNSDSAIVCTVSDKMECNRSDD